MMMSPNSSRVDKPRRHWFQFSIRTLLIATAVFALWLGIRVYRVRQQEQAVEAIGRSGGEFRYDYQEVPNSTISVNAYDSQAEIPAPEAVRELIGKHYFVTPTRLRINDQRVIDENRLVHLKDLPDLEELWFDDVKLRRGDLDCLANLSKLTALFFFSGTVPEENGPWDFSSLSRMPHLQSLYAGETPIGDPDLVQLQSSTELRKLFLCLTPVGDAGVAHMKHLANLEELDLAGTRITDAGVEHLESFHKLGFLCLRQTGISDAAVEHLGKLRGLTRLELQETKVTKEGAARLQTALPKCSIVH